MPGIQQRKMVTKMKAPKTIFFETHIDDPKDDVIFSESDWDKMIAEHRRLSREDLLKRLHAQNENELSRQKKKVDKPAR